MPWTRKHKPKRLNEVRGQELAISKLRDFVTNYSTGALMIYGPTGCGKTSAVYALANDLNYEILEINASDTRNKKSILEILGNSINQRSLFQRGKIILVDEVDGLSGNADRGGAGAVASLLNSSKWPIILTANDPFIQKLKALKKKSNMLEFVPVSNLEMLNVLKDICEKENLDYDVDVLKGIVYRNSGDVRAAVADLQTVSTNGRVDSLEVLGDRDKEKSIFDALKLVFKGSNAKDVLRAFDNVQADWRECIMWVDENLPREYSSLYLKNAYNWLSRADVFNGRIPRQQHWRYLVYIYNLLTAGIASAKDEKSTAFIDYKRSGRILKLWMAKMRYAKKKSIAEKIALKTHVSKKVAYKDILPYIHVLFRNGNYDAVANELELDEGEVTWLLDH